MSLKNTLDKIKALEAEKKNLLLELDGLKKMADAKANDLEHEVGALRDEVKTLKILMGQAEVSPNKIQILEPNPKVP
jgi:hypothetical protein